MTKRNQIDAEINKINDENKQDQCENKQNR